MNDQARPGQPGRHDRPFTTVFDIDNDVVTGAREIEDAMSDAEHQAFREALYGVFMMEESTRNHLHMNFGVELPETRDDVAGCHPLWEFDQRALATPSFSGFESVRRRSELGLPQRSGLRRPATCDRP